ncbi:SusC/RagA family TonB-linked outer membrane protein [Chitinophaga sp. sic0106]|uniref:SusC/RagA family TonB-linked outer membrane protein n=1 Tax=Chitinophaga sp. sic0106 TaxID=2854785 RepID=UPI001C482AFB|nr:SusC/RagA family TonB-linked outer membrane protein [Chitinophaga sp. sic0106]MBV7533731.1 SusC/RagA family TonB-linked outer membrane protein [Chitinophaga sp. sic0106]
MKCTAFLMLAICLHVSATGYSQRVSLKVENASLKKVFNEIRKQTGYYLVCDESLLTKSGSVTFSVTNSSIDDVLQKCFSGIPFSYSLVEKTLIIKQRDNFDLRQDSTRQVTGRIADDKGSPLIGASIKLKGTNTGTTTDENGRFSISLKERNGFLEISFIGYESKTVAVSATDKNLSLSLNRDSRQIGEVLVVTALGLGRKMSNLTYATQQLGTQELSTVKSTNVLNSLSGKVSGVQINRTSGGAGGSVRIVIRGDKSTRNSQPLYVIDGLPLLNPTGGASAEWYNSTADGGDILSTINPEDIESINILKGPSASSLYGSQGSNGVILITTKRAKAGISKVDIASNLTFDKAYNFPEQQYNYGQTTAATATTAGSEDSWGAKGATQPGSDYINKFFNTGLTWINSVGLTWGNDKTSNYLSYSNTDNKGIVPTNTLKQNSLTFRESGKFLNDKLTVDGTFMGSIQNTHNRINPGVYFNPLTGLYAFPRGLDFEQYKNFEYFSTSRYLMAQNWWNINPDKGYSGQDYQQNPYWILNRNPTDNENRNVYTALSLRYAVNDWLNVQMRGNYNSYQNAYQRNTYATTQTTLAPENGLINVNKTNNQTLYGDFVLQANKNINKDLGLNVTLGTSIQDQKGATTNVRGALTVPNVFLESAIDWTNVSRAVNTNSSIRRQIQSVFGAVELGYQDKLFLNFTDRNDWSSTLAYTPTSGKGFNYYSAGVSAVLSRIFNLPQSIDYAKVRVSYAVVGNDIDPFRTRPLYTFNAGISTPPVSNPIHVAGYYLQPEKNKSLEIGTQWSILKNRLTLDVTGYKSNITNQFFQNIAVAPGIGAGTSADVNGGNIQNTGVEVALSYGVIKTPVISWTTTLNYSYNQNKVIELFNSSIVANPSADQKYSLNGGSGFLVQGGSFGDIYGRGFKRDDQGRIMVGADNLPLSVDNVYLGNPNPKSIVGWSNSVSIHDFAIGFLIDGKFGGRVLSITEALMDQMGVSKRTGEARDNGGKVVIANAVDPTGKVINAEVDAKDYYKTIGGKGPIAEAYMYDASAIRLREFSVGYTLKLDKMVKQLKFSVIGNNLFFLYNKAPFDPEQVAAVNPGGVGVDVFGLPTYRSIGFSIKATL